jgi:hypothetical protein
MNKSFIFFFLLFCSVASFSQTLIYKSNGNILNAANEKISPDQIRELFKENEKLLADYNAGRSKKTAGNILLCVGSGFVIADIYRRIYKPDVYEYSFKQSTFYQTIEAKLIKEIKFPSALGYIGFTLIAVAVPIKIGFSKKIKNVVTDYNNQSAIGYNKPKLDLITNANGIGLRFTLN